jgi:hypothetical protein
MSFFRNGGQEDKTDPIWGLTVQKGECGGNITLMCENGKIRPVKTIPGRGGDKRE